MKFCYEKISIEMCIFLREFLPNIGLTSLGPVSMLILINDYFGDDEAKRQSEKLFSFASGPFLKKEKRTNRGLNSYLTL